MSLSCLVEESARVLLESLAYVASVECNQVLPARFDVVADIDSESIDVLSRLRTPQAKIDTNICILSQLTDVDNADSCLIVWFPAKIVANIREFAVLHVSSELYSVDRTL